MNIVKLDVSHIRKPAGWDGDLKTLAAGDYQFESLLATELRDGMYLTEKGEIMQEREDELSAVRLVPHSCTTVTSVEREIFQAAYAAWTQADILTDLIDRSQQQLAACQSKMSGLATAMDVARQPLSLEKFEESFEGALNPTMQGLLRRGMYQVGSPDGGVPAISCKIRIARVVGTGKSKATFLITMENGHPVLDRTSPAYQKTIESNRCPLPIPYSLSEELVLRDENVQYVGVYYIPFKNRPMTHALAEKTARDFCRA